MTENELPDEQLLAELRDLFSRTEPVPGWVVETAKASFDLRQLDVELALLTWDSDVDAPAVAVRGPADVLDAGPRALSFETEDLSLEVEIAPPDDGRALLGQLVPPGPATIEVQQVPLGEVPAVPGQRHRTLSVEADVHGRFSVAALDPGLTRLRCLRPGRQPVATDWVRLD